MERCTTCSTPLAEGGRCVTCEAAAEGLAVLTRSGYASVREVMSLLEAEGLAPEMEKVPPGRPEEAHHPLWNLYVPRDELERAQAFLRRDWAGLLEDPDAAAAAARGAEGIDLDAGGEITCPACGHRFAVQGAAEVECPECGLGLGAPGDAAPDEKG
jgi:DNA-directed RNA polymerase subunit RPC12/RpoP